MFVKRSFSLILFLLLNSSNVLAARTFVASNSDKVIPSEGLIQGGSWSLSIWFKLASLPSVSGQYVLFGDGSGTNRWNPLVYYENAAGTKHIRTITSSTFGVFNISDWNVNLNTGQWYHLALVSGDQGSGSNVYKIYLDSVDETWTSGGTYVNEGNHGGQPTIGCGGLDAGATFGYFDGTIGVISRWTANSGSATDAALTANEVLALSLGARPERIHPMDPGGTPRQYIWRLDGLESPEPDT